MIGELVKREDRWDLYLEDGSKYATTVKSPLQKLSVSNCETVELGYDLDEMAIESCNITDPLRLDVQKYKQDPYFRIGFKKGFQKAIEIKSDKKFAEDDIRKAIEKGMEIQRTINNTVSIPYTRINEYVKSLEKNEWQVEIATEEISEEYRDGGFKIITRAKKDKDGFLILKRV